MQLRDYISFASSVAALILAVIAIIQSMVSDRDRIETISRSMNLSAS